MIVFLILTALAIHAAIVLAPVSGSIARRLKRGQAVSRIGTATAHGLNERSRLRRENRPVSVLSGTPVLEGAS